jgi:hypothetical protein
LRFERRTPGKVAGKMPQWESNQMAIMRLNNQIARHLETIGELKLSLSRRDSKIARLEKEILGLLEALKKEQPKSDGSFLSEVIRNSSIIGIAGVKEYSFLKTDCVQSAGQVSSTGLFLASYLPFAVRKNAAITNSSADEASLRSASTEIATIVKWKRNAHFATLCYPHPIANQSILSRILTFKPEEYAWTKPRRNVQSGSGRYQTSPTISLQLRSAAPSRIWHGCSSALIPRDKSSIFVNHFPSMTVNSCLSHSD